MINYKMTLLGGWGLGGGKEKGEKAEARIACCFHYVFAENVSRFMYIRRYVSKIVLHNSCTLHQKIKKNCDAMND